MIPQTETEPAFEGLLQFLKENRGFDFTGYKRPSLMRRVRKRMAEVDIEEFEAYQDYLQVHPNEFTELFNTILINVTSFFRDTRAWDYLSGEIVPLILESKTPNSTIRMWSAGCASGEEAYSLVMMMAEAMGIGACRRQVKVYATDVDEEGLERARRGSYRVEDLAPIPPDLRGKYFDHSNSHGHYVFRRDLRRTLIFGRHDLMHDAPISRLDLLLCRNTLIYFNHEAQDRIVARFHFALKDDGYIFLGRAETMLVHDQLFEPASIKHRVFCKVDAAKPRERMEALVQAGRDLGIDAGDSRLYLRRAALEAVPLAQILVDHRARLVLANEQARRLLGLTCATWIDPSATCSFRTDPWSCGLSSNKPATKKSRSLSATSSGSCLTMTERSIWTLSSRPYGEVTMIDWARPSPFGTWRSATRARSSWNRPGTSWRPPTRSYSRPPRNWRPPTRSCSPRWKSCRPPTRNCNRLAKRWRR